MSWQNYFRLDVSPEGVAEIVLNRPNKLNVMDNDFFLGFGQLVQEAAKRDDIKVIIIWSEGRLFTAGLDLKAATSIIQQDSTQSASANSIKIWKLIKLWQDCFSQLQHTNKPTIAAIHSKCIGGGVDMVTAADIRLCTKDATFSVTETKLAMVADLGTVQRLTKLVPRGFAREMIFTGEAISADRAFRFGLVNEVYDTKDQMLQAARTLAKTIAGNSGLVVQSSKAVIKFAEEHTVADGLEHIALWNAGFLPSSDLQEGFMAIMAKKTPNYTAKL